MSAWLESGRSAVEEALAAAFDKIDENIRTGIYPLPGKLRSWVSFAKTIGRVTSPRSQGQ